MLVLVLAMRLGTSTILPGSWIELEPGGTGDFSIQADDGFFIIGGFDPQGHLLSGDPDEFGRFGTWFLSLGLDAWASSVSSPWIAGDGFAADGDGIGLEMAGPECELVAVCGPFTFFGYLDAGGAPAGSPIWPLRYEFSGQGTAYLTIASDRDHPYVSSVRYEFEAVENDVPEIPEPSTWGLLALGLGAAVWISRRSAAIPSFPRRGPSKSDSVVRPGGVARRYPD